MSYQIYTTEGIVLRGKPFGESHKFLQIYTKDFGLIGASVRSVRDLKSKLRYNLATLSCSEISLVRGKNEWKIVSARLSRNFYSDFFSNNEALLLVARALSLIEALCPGEEKNLGLYETVNKGFEFLCRAPLTKSELLNFEPVLILRIIRDLGYLEKSHHLDIFSKSDEWTENLIVQMQTHRREAVTHINRALKESQLVR